MAFIPGASSTTSKAVDGLEGATSGSAVSLPSGFSGPSQRPFAAADANLTMTVATHGGLVSMTPTATRTITLPSTSVYTGYSVEIVNLSATQSINVNASGGGSLTVVGASSSVKVFATTSAPTLPAQWAIANAGALLLNGNSVGSAITVGTNDNFGFNVRTNGTTKLSIDTGGAVTLNPTSGLGTGAGAYNLAYGSLVLRNGTNARGIVSSNDVFIAGTNIYRDGTGTIKATSTQTGYTFFEMTRNGTAFDLQVSSAAQTADTTITTPTSIGSASLAGAWTLGTTTGSGLEHIAQSNGQTQLTVRAGSTNNVILNFRKGSSNFWSLAQNAGSSDNFEIYGGTGASTVYATCAHATGAWTLGPSGFNAEHRINTSTTTAAPPTNGAAGALTANPAGYIVLNINGTLRRIPYYNN